MDRRPEPVRAGAGIPAEVPGDAFVSAARGRPDVDGLEVAVEQRPYPRRSGATTVKSRRNSRIWGCHCRASVAVECSSSTAGPAPSRTWRRITPPVVPAAHHTGHHTGQHTGTGFRPGPYVETSSTWVDVSRRRIPLRFADVA